MQPVIFIKRKCIDCKINPMKGLPNGFYLLHCNYFKLRFLCPAWNIKGIDKAFHFLLRSNFYIWQQRRSGQVVVFVIQLFLQQFNHSDYVPSRYWYCWGWDTKKALFRYKSDLPFHSVRAGLSTLSKYQIFKVSQEQYVNIQRQWGSGRHRIKYTNNNLVGTAMVKWVTAEKTF